MPQPKRNHDDAPPSAYDPTYDADAHWQPLAGDVTVYWPVARLVLEIECRRPLTPPDGQPAWPTPVWVVLPNGTAKVCPKDLITEGERAYLKAHRDALLTVLTYTPPVV